MAISEDTAAIVAATLTAAHCSANNPFARDNPKSGDELRDAVLGLFEHYQKAIRKDGVIYSPPPE